MRVLVTGGYGFIGSHVVAALLDAGHEPVVAVRASRCGMQLPGIDSIPCDFSEDIDPQAWVTRLRGIDAVVNCAGILRERGADTFRNVHEKTPAALFAACVAAGVRRVVQVSALGDPADGEFIASKHRGDDALMATDLDWTVLRPSVVYSTRGSYGGTSLLRGLAALPLIPLPGDGRQRFQPIDATDLGRAVVASIESPQSMRRCLSLGGPECLTLCEYLALWRRWLGLGKPRFIRVPLPLACVGAWVGERAGRGPLGETMWRMLLRGNALPSGAYRDAADALGFEAKSMVDVLARQGGSSADRWHARLHFLAPALRAALAITWIASGVVGFGLPQEQVLGLFAETVLSKASVLAMAWFGSAVDIGLGTLLLAGWRIRRILLLMGLSVLAYTLFIGIVLPQAWFDPFGGLLKNGVLLAALAIAAATAERD